MLKKFSFIFLLLLNASANADSGSNNHSFQYQQQNSPVVRPQPTFHQNVQFQNHSASRPNTIILNQQPNALHPQPNLNAGFHNRAANVNQPNQQQFNNSHRNNYQNSGYIYTPTYVSYPDYDYPVYPFTDDSYDNSTPAVTENSIDTAVSNIQSLPDGLWMTMNNGNVPDNAIVYQTVANGSNYYCRAQYNNMLYYGVLIPNDGCYIQDNNVTMRFTQYDALVHY